MTTQLAKTLLKTHKHNHMCMHCSQWRASPWWLDHEQFPCRYSLYYTVVWPKDMSLAWRRLLSASTASRHVAHAHCRLYKDAYLYSRQSQVIVAVCTCVSATITVDLQVIVALWSGRHEWQPPHSFISILLVLLQYWTPLAVWADGDTNQQMWFKSCLFSVIETA